GLDARCCRSDAQLPSLPPPDDLRLHSNRAVVCHHRPPTPSLPPAPPFPES
ncbi:unnamed protein product, partial [Citrullus colocynthis]